MKVNRKYESVVAVLAAFMLVFIWKSWEWLIYIGICIGFLSLLSGKFAELVSKGWFKLAEILGWIVSKVVLSVIFFLFLMPLSFLYRIFSKDPLKLKKGYSTYFIDRNHKFKKEDMEYMW